MALKELVLSVALMGAGYGICAVVNRDTVHLPEAVVEREMVPGLVQVKTVYAEKSPADTYRDLVLTLKEDPVQYAGLIEDMINKGYELLPQVKQYVRPKGVRSHEHPYDLRVIVLEESLPSGDGVAVVARPYLFNGFTHSVKEISEKEYTGSAFNMYTDLGKDASDVIKGVVPFLQKGADKLKDVGGKIIDSQEWR